MSYSLQQRLYEIEDLKVLLYEPVKEEIQTAYQQKIIAFPYWSQVWPAAIALAQFLQKKAYLISEKKVLELAAGLGLPSFVAAHYAAEILTSDYAPEAVSVMRKTVELNNFKNINVQILDWYSLPDDLNMEVLLLSDISYDEKLFSLQEKVIKQFLKKGTMVIISTPQRLVAKEALSPLVPFCIQQEEQEVMHHGKSVFTSVMVLSK